MATDPSVSTRSHGDAAWAAGSVPGVTSKRRVASRFSSGHLVMIVAGLVAALLCFAALRDRPTGVFVAVADRDIRAGDTVTASDFRTERVDVPPRLLDTLVRSREVRAARGEIAVSAIQEGDLVARHALRPRAAPDGLRAMSIPIDASLAVAGRLAPGDRVDVLFAGSDAASIIVPDALVLAVDQRSRGGIGETSSPFTVTLAVSAEQSQLLAAAIADGDVSIARTTGARSSAGVAPLPLERTTTRGQA
ncbi:MAG: Flp pilus assembly protein CpaB [Acidimicrobiia bacterium]